MQAISKGVSFIPARVRDERMAQVGGCGGGRMQRCSDAAMPTSPQPEPACTLQRNDPIKATHPIAACPSCDCYFFFISCAALMLACWCPGDAGPLACLLAGLAWPGLAWRGVQLARAESVGVERSQSALALRPADDAYVQVRPGG